VDVNRKSSGNTDNDGYQNFVTTGNQESTGSATARSLAILSAVSESVESVSAVELASKLGLSKATVHRLMQLLESLGYLQREPGSKRFILGSRANQMALATMMNSPHRAVRHAILRSLVDEVQETCNITILAGDEIAYIDRVESHWPLRTHFQPGSRIPLHCGASGKLFLSMMPALKRRRLLTAAPLRKYTDKTVIDPAEIEKELKHIRASKVGVDNEEFLQGLIGVAVPVFDRRGRICATVSIHVPTGRHNVTQAMGFAANLNRATGAIAKTLDW
jgi:IclR family transcriptional regulator, acetate operon repressor